MAFPNIHSLSFDIKSEMPDLTLRPMMVKQPGNRFSIYSKPRLATRNLSSSQDRNMLPTESWNIE